MYCSWISWTFLLISLICTQFVLAAELRTWKDSSGTHTIEAKLIDYKSGSVILEKEDGQQLTVPSAKLSASDQRYIREELKARKSMDTPGSADARSADSSIDWTHWRGPTSNGIASSGQDVPSVWDESEHLVWKTPIPGRGHSSPTVVGDKVILTSADAQQQSQTVFCYSRKDGVLLWSTEVNQGGFPSEIHGNNTHATPTVACNGEQLFVVFCNHGNAQLSSLDLNGKILWQVNAGSYQPQQFKWGYAPSPLIYKDSVIVASEFEQGFIAAFGQSNGRRLWGIPRPGHITLSSPVIAKVAGRDQLLISGGNKVSSYDPSNGRGLWQVEGAAQEITCGTMVWDGDFVFASGGFTTAILADGSGRVAWRNQIKCYEQSMLASNGYLYGITDDGIAFCCDAKTGEEKWKSRLGGRASSSPILVNDLVFQANERGTMFVFKANPNKFEEVARNQIGDEMFSTPAVCGNQIFLRTADRSNGSRQEYLYCLANDANNR
ncbi:MAG: outer membrane protein assembly factor BamB family protein [Pirellulales bacterium]